MRFYFNNKKNNLKKISLKLMFLMGLWPAFCLIASGGNGANVPVAVDDFGHLIRWSSTATGGLAHKSASEPEFSFLEAREEDGLLLWEFPLIHSGRLTVADLAVYQSRIALVGTFSGVLELDGFTLRAEAGFQAFFAIFDLEGRLFWAGQAGGKGDVFGQALTVDAMGMSLVGDFEGRGFRFPLPVEDPENLSPSVTIFDLDGNFEKVMRLRVIPITPWRKAWELPGLLDGTGQEFMPISDGGTSPPPPPPPPPPNGVDPNEEEAA